MKMFEKLERYLVNDAEREARNIIQDKYNKKLELTFCKGKIAFRDNSEYYGIITLIDVQNEYEGLVEVEKCRIVNEIYKRLTYKGEK